MPKPVTLLDALTTDFPEVEFIAGEQFAWLPGAKQITYVADDPLFGARLLHEVAHAVLGHDGYERDIDLIACERDAWQYARMTLAPQYGVTIDADSIHADMDTYREWLHARSTCPVCRATGLQIKRSTYRCLACAHTWRVNEAKHCSLRRYTV